MEQATIVWFGVGTAVIGGLIILLAGFCWDLAVGWVLRSGSAMSGPLVRIFAPAIAHRRLEARNDLPLLSRKVTPIIVQPDYTHCALRLRKPR